MGPCGPCGPEVPGGPPGVQPSLSGLQLFHELFMPAAVSCILSLFSLLLTKDLEFDELLLKFINGLLS
jgi:hypothetical protein